MSADNYYSYTSTACVAVPVTVGTTSGGTVIAAANTKRKEIVLQNNGLITCIIRLGGDPSTTAYNLTLKGGTGARDGLGASITINFYQGEIKGITESSSTVISVMEITD